MWSAPFERLPELTPISFTILRSERTILPIESSMLPFVTCGISPLRSPSATRAMNWMASDGSPPTCRITPRAIVYPSQAITASKPSEMAKSEIRRSRNSCSISST